MNLDTQRHGGGSLGRIGVILLYVCAALCLLALVYVAILWYQTGKVLERGAELTDESNASVISLKDVIESFRGDPDSAAILVPALNEEQLRVSDIRSRAPEIGNRPLPPLGPITESYEESIVTYLEHVDSYYENLIRVAQFVVARSDAMTQVGEGLSVLNGLSDPDATEEEIARVIGEARDSVDDCVASVRTLRVGPVHGGIVYSNDALLSRLTRLSSSLSEIERGLSAKDEDVVGRATREFSSLMGADWQGLFFEADRAGLEQFRSSLLDLDADRQAIVEARDDVAAYRATLWAIGFGLLIVGVFLGALARLR